MIKIKGKVTTTLTVFCCSTFGEQGLTSNSKKPCKTTAPSTLTRFCKCRFSSRRKRSKTFSSEQAFSYRFHQSTLKTLENDEKELRMR